MASPCTSVHGTTLGRYGISNAWAGSNEGLYIFSDESINPVNWGVSRYELKGAFRQIGIVKGGTQLNGTQFGTDPIVLNSVPILQNHTHHSSSRAAWTSLAWCKGPMGSSGHSAALCHYRTAARIELRCSCDPTTTTSG